MTIAIPFPVPNKGFALNSKLRVNLDAIVTELNKVSVGDTTLEKVVVHGDDVLYPADIIISPYGGILFPNTLQCNSDSDFRLSHFPYTGDAWETLIELGSDSIQFYIYPASTKGTMLPLWLERSSEYAYFEYDVSCPSLLVEPNAGSGVEGTLSDGDIYATGKLTVEGNALVWGNLYLRGSLFSQGGNAFDLTPLQWLKADAGKVTQPSQPSFMVYKIISSNATGDGTAFTAVFDVERFDQDGNFSTNTFTAPVTGKYSLSVIVQFGDLDTDLHTTIDLAIVTSNYSYSNRWETKGVAAATLTVFTAAFSVLADMDAGDTATVLVTVAGTNKNVDVSPSFSGSLIN